jgi:hypothetical protein
LSDKPEALKVEDKGAKAEDKAEVEVDAEVEVAEANIPVSAGNKTER